MKKEKNGVAKSWTQLALDLRIQKGLQALQFTQPTEVQAVSLAHLHTRRDLIISAKTGAGKTLCFGLPILNRLVEEWDSIRQQCSDFKEALLVFRSHPRALIMVPTRELAVQIASDITAVLDGAQSLELKKALFVAPVVGGMAIQKQERVLKRNAPIIVATPGRLWDIMKEDFIVGFKERLPLIDFLVLDEADRMLEDGHFRQLRYILNFIYVSKAKRLKLIASNSAASEPSMNMKEFLKSQKQDNIGQIKYKMKLVEGGMDPGLIEDINQAELLDEGNGVLDEPIIMNSDEEKQALQEDTESLWKKVNGRQLNIQTFISSATLTLDGVGETKKRPKKVQQKLAKKVDQLYESLKFRGKPVLINLSAQQLFPQQQIKQEYSFCKNNEEKETLLYFLLQDKKSTIVFLNSLGSAKKLASLLKLLELQINLLHARMQQKQRLKQLDSFKSKIAKGQKALMVATDVAARGLHIPSVQHIVHYQIPKSPQLYLHRIGRSARLQNTGHSISLVSPEELNDFKRIYKSLKTELSSFKVGGSQLAHFSELVSKARNLEKANHTEHKAEQEEKWTKEIAKKAGLDPKDADLRVIKREKKLKVKEEKKNKDKEEFKSLMAGKDLLSKSTYLSPAKLKYLNSLGDSQKPVQSSPFVRHRMQKTRKITTKQRQKKRRKK